MHLWVVSVFSHCIHTFSPLHLFFVFILSLFVAASKSLVFLLGLLPVEGQPRRVDAEAEERTLWWNLQDLQVSYHMATTGRCAAHECSFSAMPCFTLSLKHIHKWALSSTTLCHRPIIYMYYYFFLCHILRLHMHSVFFSCFSIVQPWWDGLPSWLWWPHSGAEQLQEPDHQSQGLFVLEMITVR